MAYAFAYVQSNLILIVGPEQRCNETTNLPRFGGVGHYMRCKLLLIARTDLATRSIHDAERVRLPRAASVCYVAT